VTLIILGEPSLTDLLRMTPDHHRSNLPGASPEPLLVGELTLEQGIRQAAALFDQAGLAYGHGTDNAIDEASWLLLEALGLPPEQPPDYQRELTAAELDHCNRQLARRLHERVPTAYLVGSAWFAGHRFLSDARALVPRSPLAQFINDDFHGLIAGTPGIRILDLCTGGGCIGIACALAIPDTVVDASDISATALTLAAENVALHGVAERVNLREGSLFEPIAGLYDLILSNPPYVDARDIEAMPAEFDHEPLLGLAAGDDGLDIVREILRDAARYLRADGVLVVEVGNSASAMKVAWPSVPFDWLHFAEGGEGVFALTRDELVQHAGSFR